MKHLDEGRLQAWLDRPRSGLGPDEAREIEAHLQSCDECARRLAALEDLDARAASILSSVEPEDADAPPFREVSERARQAGGKRASPRPRVVLTWAASVVLALGVGWMANEVQSGQQVAFGPETTTVELPSDSRGAGSVGAEAEPDTVGRVAGADAERARQEAPADAAESRQAAAPAAPAEERAATREPVQEPRGGRIVRGRVTDEEGRPLASAQVAVREADAGALTDENGSYSLQVPEDVVSVDTGFYVTATLIGHATNARRVAPAGDTLTADFRLAQQHVALQELAVTAGAVTEDRDDEDDAPDWRALSPAAAEAQVGFPTPAVPGLEVLAVEVGELEGAAAVRVRQVVEPGTVLTLLQRRATGATEAEDQPDGLTTVSIRRDDLLLTATAALPADSLQTLLERAR